MKNTITNIIEKALIGDKVASLKYMRKLVGETPIEGISLSKEDIYGIYQTMQNIVNQHQNYKVGGISNE